MTAGKLSAMRMQAPLVPKQTLSISTLCGRGSHITVKMAPKRKSTVPTPVSVLEQLQQSQSLKLLAIAETLAPKDLPQSANKRNSAVSEDSEQNGDTHPAALEADLLHYKVRMLYLTGRYCLAKLHFRSSSASSASVTSNKSPKRSFSVA